MKKSMRNIEAAPAITGVLLVIWFLVSYGFGIVFADQLDATVSADSDSDSGFPRRVPCMCL